MKVVRALQAHQPEEEERDGKKLLPFKEGEMIAVIHSENSWSAGRMNDGSKGWFPSSYVKEIDIEWDQFKAMSPLEKKNYLAKALTKHLATEKEQKQRAQETNRTEELKSPTSTHIKQDEQLEKTMSNIENVTQSDPEEQLKRLSRIVPSEDSNNRNNSSNIDNENVNEDANDSNDNNNSSNSDDVNVNEDENKVESETESDEDEGAYVVNNGSDYSSSGSDSDSGSNSNSNSDSDYGSAEENVNVTQEWRPLSAVSREKIEPVELVAPVIEDRSRTNSAVFTRRDTSQPMMNRSRTQTFVNKRNTGFNNRSSVRATKARSQYIETFTDLTSEIEKSVTITENLRCMQKGCVTIDESIIKVDDTDTSFFACRMNVATIVSGIKILHNLGTTIQESLELEQLDGKLTVHMLGFKERRQKVIALAKTMHLCVKTELSFQKDRHFKNLDLLHTALMDLLHSSKIVDGAFAVFEKQKQKEARLKKMEAQMGGDVLQRQNALHLQSKETKTVSVHDKNASIYRSPSGISRSPSSVSGSRSRSTSSSSSHPPNSNYALRDFHEEVENLKSLNQQMAQVIRDMIILKDKNNAHVTEQENQPKKAVEEELSGSYSLINGKIESTIDTSSDSDSDSDAEAVSLVSIQKNKSSTISITSQSSAKEREYFSSAFDQIDDLCKSMDANADKAVAQISKVMEMVSEGTALDYVPAVTEVVRHLLETVKFASKSADLVGKGPCRTAITQCQMNLSTSLGGLVSSAKVASVLVDSSQKTEKDKSLAVLMKGSSLCLRRLFDLQGSVYIAIGIHKAKINDVEFDPSQMKLSYLNDP